MLAIAGPDAVRYLRFQIFLIWFLFLVSLFSLCIILPINLQGNRYRNSTSPAADYERTLFDNLDSRFTLHLLLVQYLIFLSRSPYLYAHDILAFILFFLAIVWMKKFSKPYHFKDVDINLTRTLLIKKIPPELATNDNIKKHFDEAYPSLTVTQVNVAYNVSELIKKTQELKEARDTIEAAEKHREAVGEPLKMYPRRCSLFSGCFCRCCSEKVEQLSTFRTKNEYILIRWMLLNTTPRRRFAWRKRWLT